MLDIFKKIRRKAKIRKVLRSRVESCLDKCKYLKNHKKSHLLWECDYKKSDVEENCLFFKSSIFSINNKILSKMYITKNELTKLIRVEFRTISNKKVYDVPDILLNFDYDIIYCNSNSLRLLNEAYKAISHIYDNDQIYQEISEVIVENEIDLWDSI